MNQLYGLLLVCMYVCIFRLFVSFGWLVGWLVSLGCEIYFVLSILRFTVHFCTVSCECKYCVFVVLAVIYRTQQYNSTTVYPPSHRLPSPGGVKEEKK